MPSSRVGVAQQLAVLEERGVGPVVGDEASEAQPEPRVVVAVVVHVARERRDVRVLPLAPADRRTLAHLRIGVLQHSGIRGREVAVALAGRHDVAERLPFAREDATHRAGDPLDLASGGRHDADEDHLGHAVWVRLGVGEAERRSPRPSPDEPSVDAEVLPESLDVIDEMCGRVRREVDDRLSGVRSAPAAAALIEEHDPIAIGVEPAPKARRRTASRAAVQDDRGLAVGVAGDAPREPVSVSDVEHAPVVRLAEREGHGRDRARSTVGAQARVAELADAEGLNPSAPDGGVRVRSPPRAPIGAHVLSCARALARRGVRTPRGRPASPRPRGGTPSTARGA